MPRKYPNCRLAVEAWRGLHGRLCEPTTPCADPEHQMLYMVHGAGAQAQKSNRERGGPVVPKMKRSYREAEDYHLADYVELSEIFMLVRQRASERDWAVWYAYHVLGRHQRQEYWEARIVKGKEVMVKTPYPEECLVNMPCSGQVAKAWNAMQTEERHRISGDVVIQITTRMVGKVEAELKRRGMLGVEEGDDRMGVEEAV